MYLQKTIPIYATCLQKITSSKWQLGCILQYWIYYIFNETHQIVILKTTNLSWSLLFTLEIESNLWMIHKTCNVILFLGMEDRWPETFEALLMSLSAAASNFYYMIAYLMMILFNTRNPQYTCNHDMQVLSRQFLAFYEYCYFPNGKIYRSKDELTPNCGHLEAFYFWSFWNFEWFYTK